MESLLGDLRFAARALAKARGHTAVVVLILSLGVATNAIIFSVLNAVFLEPLPYPDPDELVAVGESRARSPGYISNDVFLDWREASESFDGMAFYSGPLEGSLTGRGEPEVVSVSSVSPAFFPLLRVSPFLGRTFLPEEDEPPQNRVALLSHALWQTRFEADRDVIGKTITLDGQVRTVVGVLPPGFDFVGVRFPRFPATGIWIPSRIVARRDGKPPTSFGWNIARLRKGVSLAKAEAEGNARVSDGTFRVHVVPFSERLVQTVKPALLMLQVAVGLVLLIVCSNVANLLLVRASGRQTEMAIRAALGASRRRILRQLLIESLLPSGAGGVLGFLLTIAGTPVVRSVVPRNVPRLEGIGVDGSVLGFAVAISLLTALLCGLAPALHGARVDLKTSLQSGAAAGSGGRSRLRSALTVVEIAAGVVLTVGSMLLLKSFLNFVRLDRGYDSSRVLTLQLRLPRSQYPDASSHVAFYDSLLPRLARIPGVDAMGVGTAVPLTPVTVSWEAVLPEGAEQEIPNVHIRLASEGFFDAVGFA